VATYNVPNISGTELSGLLQSYGGSYQAIPDGNGGFNVSADPLSGIGAALGGSSNVTNSSGSYSYDPFLEALQGQAGDTPSATLFGGNAQQSDSLTSPGTQPTSTSSFFAQYGVDAISIVVGLIIIVAAVVKIV